MNTKQAGEQLGIDRRRVGELIREHKIYAQFIGNRWIITQESVDKYKAAQKTE